MPVDTSFRQKLKIGGSENVLRAHLYFGGSVLDVKGHQMVWDFVRGVDRMSVIHEVIARHRFALSEIAMIYAGMIEGLMPEPWRARRSHR